jgi:hypothetical protein
MGKVKKTKKPNKRVRNKSKKWLIPVILLLLMGLAAAMVYGLLNKSATEPAATVSPKKETPDFDRLVGNWVRPDGGYVIEIRKIYPDGKVDAAYFNPRSIHVSRSTVSEKDGIIELFIELQGQGYPGSTYTLKYNPTYDAMVGGWDLFPGGHSAAV